eukprot:9010346-Alexandrium_andersonii.AAC.1
MDFARGHVLFALRGSPIPRWASLPLSAGAGCTRHTSWYSIGGAHRLASFSFPVSAMRMLRSASSC